MNPEGLEHQREYKPAQYEASVIGLDERRVDGRRLWERQLLDKF